MASRGELWRRSSIEFVRESGSARLAYVICPGL
jgi:hypothetical protein